MNGTPVRPRTDTDVSALPAASDPPAAKSTSSQPMPASASARARGDRRHLEARHAGVAAERMDADADDRHVVVRAHSPSSAGRKAKVTAPPSPGAGTSTSSIGIPMRSWAGSASVSRASTRTSPGSST